MQRQLNRFVTLAKRWAWVVVLGIVICGGITYFVSKRIHPIYQASAIIVVNVGDPASGGTISSLAAVPTYAQLLNNPLILNPVVAKHPGMTLQQLDAMILIKPQTSTQLIELDVQNGNPKLATELANEIGLSFEQYANGQLPGAIQIWPAQEPTDPVKPKPLQDAGIGALVGLGLAIALIVIFEWIEDHPAGPEAVQELLGMEILVTIPNVPEKKRGKRRKEHPIMAEKYRMLCASLNAMQAVRPFKMLMVTSALAGEGKSTVASNLASFLAMSGKRVLLVDANLRHPALDQRFQLSNHRGLSNVFVEMWSSPRIELYGQETDIPTLRVLTAGISPSNPAEILQSPLAIQLFEHYKNTPFDYIIIDTPPLLPVADAQIVATLVQAVILVVDANKPPRRALIRAKRLLSRTRAVKIGAVINKSPWSDYGDDLHYPGKMPQTQIDSAMLMPPNTSVSFWGLMPQNTPIPYSTTITPPVIGRQLIRPPASFYEAINQNEIHQTYRQQRADE